MRAIRKWGKTALAIAFWLLVWHAVSVTVGQEILLVSPARAFSRLFSLMQTREFYATIGYTFLRILAGFALAVVVAVLLAALSKASGAVRAVVAPLMQIVKTTPVASFVILALIWIRASDLSIFISFLMGLPIVYISVLEGLESADVSLLEMARVFGVTPIKKIRAIYAPTAYPFLLSAVTAALGLCWKAGVAAEVIGIPDGSIGEALYRAKLFLSTPDLFAWTIAIILISVLFEKLVLLALRGKQTADR